MTTPDSTETDHFARVTAIDRWVFAAMMAAWAQLDVDNLQNSYVYDTLPDLTAALVAGQQEAADQGAQHAEDRAEELDVPSDNRVNTTAFAGIASDGRPLSNLLLGPLLRTYYSRSLGNPPAVSLNSGAVELESIAVTQIHDAAREVESTAMAANDGIRGYVRVVEPGACSRCIILAGKFFRWNAGFHRHPRCRCHHRQLAKDEGFYAGQDPKEIFDGMSREQQNRIFTNAGADAVRNGADLGRVVNARKGMATSVGPTGLRRDKKVSIVNGQPVYTTVSGTGSRRSSKTFRLMPESIISLADGDRVETERLLRLYKYIY